jgi:hypothetical protein
MASTYTTDLAIQLMATGENAGTWGQITNTNLVVIQQAIAGYQAISIAGGAQTTALLMTQNALSTARNAVIKLTGTITGNQIVTVPNGIEKTWIVSNGTVGAFTVNFKYASTGTGQTWTTTDKGIKLLYSDGTDIQVVDLSTLSGTVATAQIANFAVGTSQLATNAVTAIKITQSTITQAKLASNSVGATQIIQSTITQAKLAANSVGANQLISTGVTAASYTAASITVDADGRITAASSGSAGAGMGIPVLAVAGPTSGTYTANPTANRIGVYMYAGGGGSTPRGGPQGNSVGFGGDGGFGFYNKPIAQPFSQPYSVGAGGNNNPTNANSGGNTTLTNVGTVNGGAGGQRFPTVPGANGNAPGADLTPPFGFRQGPIRVRSYDGTSNSTRDGTGPAGATSYFGGGANGAVSVPEMCMTGAAGIAGNEGALIIFENTGT